MVEFDPTLFGFQAGSGALIGGVIGYAAKKILKVVAVLVGLQLGLLAYLENQGIVTIDWAALQSFSILPEAAASGGIPLAVTNALSVLPATGGVAAGAIVGFKKG